MSLKINNDTITISDLTGGNSDATYFGRLTQLVPNKTGYKLFGSNSQRNQLKQFVNDNFPHTINYTPKFSNIVNPGDNTSFYITEQSTHYIYSSFSTSKYIKLLNAFKPGNNSWSIIIKLKTPSNFSYSNQFFGSHSSYYKTIGGEFGTNQNFGCGITSNGSSWDIGWIWGTTTLTANTWYYYKLSFIGTQYILESKKDGNSNYILQGVIDSTTPIYQGADSIICLGHQGNGYLRGELDLTATKITIGDTVWFDGSTAVENTDYTLVGNPNITTEIISTYTPSPFTFSFDLDSSAFTEGTKYLLEHPNLIKVKTENNKLYFNFPWKDNSWYYLPNNILQEGTNTVSLNTEGTPVLGKIKFSVNNHNFTLLDTTKLAEIAYNFSDYNYLTLPDYINEEDNLTSFEIITAINMTTASNNNLGIIDTNGTTGTVGWRLTTSSSNTLHFRVSIDGQQTYPIDITGTTNLSTNKWKWAKVIYNSAIGYELFISNDGQNWNSDGTSSNTTRPYKRSTLPDLRLGDNTATGLFLTGKLSLKDTKITVNGVVKYNGATDKTYTIVGDPTLEPVYVMPLITTGVLGYKEDLIF